MDYQSAFRFLVDDLEGDSGTASVYGDTYGIEPQNWKLYCLKHGDNVVPITRGGATHFYYDEYWVPLRCNEISSGLDFCLFEWAVNHGSFGAVKSLQICVGCTPDGLIGPITINAVRQANTAKVTALFLARQVDWYKSDALANPDAPLVGWDNRVRKVCKIVGIDPKLVGLK